MRTRERLPMRRDHDTFCPLNLYAGEKKIMLFVNIILPVFIIILTGYVLQKKTRMDLMPLSNLSLYVLTPALIFSSMVKKDIDFSAAGQIGLFMLAYTAALLAVGWLLARRVRLDEDSTRALYLTTSVMNVGNFGLPLAYFAFGDAGLPASLMTFVLFNIPLGTLAIVLAQGRGASVIDALHNSLKIPIFHGCLLAFAIRGAGISVPVFLLRPAELLGQAAVPLMLLILGMQLARTQIPTLSLFFPLSAVLRLILAPLIAWGLTRALGIQGVTQGVVILQTSTPSAILPLLYSLRFNTRPDLVAGAIFINTLLCGFSLTLILYLLQA